MNLPNLIIPGASRSGTSFLFGILKQHPQIFTPPIKELQFFEKEIEYTKGMSHYSNHFKGSECYDVRMESSPPYFHKGILIDEQGKHKFNEQDDAVSRIAKHLPDAKILITLRNPIERLYSQYNKNYFQGKETESFRDALSLEKKGQRTPDKSPLCWIYKNQYSIHLKHWFDHFPKENIKIIIFEDWIKNKKVIEEEVMDFLNIEQFKFNYELGKNTGSSYAKRRKWKFNPFGVFKKKTYSKISKSQFELLRTILIEDIKDTEKLLSLDLKHWLNYE